MIYRQRWPQANKFSANTPQIEGRELAPVWTIFTRANVTEARIVMHEARIVMHVEESAIRRRCFSRGGGVGG